MAERRDSVKRLWQGQARRFALWVPVSIGLGIWLRFDGGAIAALAVGVALAVGALFSKARAYVFWTGIAVVAGVMAAETRLAAVDAPVLDRPWRGDVSGRVVVVDASLSGAPRLTLDHVAMEGVVPPPVTVRVSLRRGTTVPRVGDRARLPAVLAAPRGPAEPGGFDFSRKAYFDRLGAVGYGVGAVETTPVDRHALPLQLRIDRLRGEIAASLRARIGGTEGAVAAALVVGDRSGIPAEARDALRDSGLAHLLAISGLHVGLLGALVYWVVRLSLALPPQVSERFAIRKVAAVCALGAVGVYLVMSGASVATQRAFVMAGVALLAIVFDRGAVTMRGLAVAAVLILLLRPESLFEAGFQMSFAAVAVLVAGYDSTRDFWRRRAERGGIVTRLSSGVLATAMTSILAGVATAPFAAYHFNRLVIWGLPANLLATPLMGLWIMPCILLAAILSPLGLDGPVLTILGIGIGFILGVAEWFGEMEGAVSGAVAASPFILSCMVFGGLWLTIWRGVVRFAGIVPIAISLFLWSNAARPDLIIARDAALIAGRGEDGRLWVSRGRAETYAARTWLRRDGEARPDRDAAYRRREWSCTKRRCRGWTGDDRRVVYLREGAVQSGDCGAGAILIAPHLPSPEDGECLFIGAGAFDGTSALALELPEGEAPVLRTAHPWRRNRLRGDSFASEP